MSEQEVIQEPLTCQEEPEPTTQVAIYNPQSLIQLAIQKDFDVERLKQLMELQERWQANEAKKAFVRAMTEFKKNPPKIFKDSHVKFDAGKGKVEYNHATLANVASVTADALSKHGLSARWETKQDSGQVYVTCIITHVDGHSESTCLNAAPDTSGSKNPIQAIGSAVTYLQRYTLLTITGLATNEFEDDGRASGKPVEQKPPVKTTAKKPEPTKGTTTRVTLEEQAQITFKKNCSYAQKELNILTGSDEAFWQVIGNSGFSSIEEIPANKYNIIRDSLKLKMNELKSDAAANEFKDVGKGRKPVTNQELADYYDEHAPGGQGKRPARTLEVQTVIDWCIKQKDFYIDPVTKLIYKASEVSE